MSAERRSQAAVTVTKLRHHPLAGSGVICCGTAILAVTVTGGTPVPLPNDTTTPWRMGLTWRNFGGTIRGFGQLIISCYEVLP